jgi:hypothetical protein
MVASDVETHFYILELNVFLSIEVNSLLHSKILIIPALTWCKVLTLEKHWYWEIKL